MHAMQYEITLPADYDMGVIRKRVADKGHLLDAHPGLGLKAYLVRERGQGGSPVNQYAPFYLWRTAEGMNGFLWGPGFRGLSADFGRPAVHHWLGAGLVEGTRTDAPTTATRTTVRLPETADPAEALEQAVAELAQFAAFTELPARPGQSALHTAAVAVDPSRWELLTLALWHGPAPEDAPGTRYQVLHLSRPELDRLPAGRHW
ncbi:DUF4865 family protein [Kitasatospora aureofaciens]|uniref:DUF4865 domain-containing protein n=1 Tax=Kitasatospora aureofaciens TaxID=1894 RepID=A0A1E7NDW2_KITAU|nr:DUF4865 family protein [Kitasatospora aureofaciens]ARF77720.1 DUF4865 domain-containing protein [Kitasatospora aureofaciens]OEV38683.1 DUF4865 domain-containing protein [Kitasatospora aureofaciens]GGU74525.1 DUF4865 domain-containing protein [Kitasatospora aureofaciens]